MKALGSAVALVLCLTACHRGEKPPERTAPWLASASASAKSALPLRRAHYTLKQSHITLELPGRHATPHGELGQAHSELAVDLDDLSQTTGDVLVDLDGLGMLGGDGQQDATYTARALSWLELGSGVTGEQRDANRTASFALRALDAGHVVSAPDGDHRVNRRPLVSSWSVRGELSLHGVRAPLTADVSLTLVPGPSENGPPVELVIRSRRPLVVSLGTHDIRPRDERGVAIAKDLTLLGDKVGLEAKVSFELSYVPQP